MLMLTKEIVNILNAGYYGMHAATDGNGDPFGPQTIEGKLAGTPFCDGKFDLVCWGLCADLEHFCNAWKLPHFKNLDPCWSCPADRHEGSAMPVTDVSLDAAWKHALTPGPDIPTTHPIGQLIGLTRAHCPGDLMHSGNLGIEIFQGSAEVRRGKVWARVAAAYARLGTCNRIHHLSQTWSNLATTPCV